MSIGTRHFGEVQSQTMRAYAQSRQYHTIVESRVYLTKTDQLKGTAQVGGKEVIVVT